MENRHLFCFGLGYVALTLAKSLLGEGWRVSGTCRNAKKCEELQSLGITAYIFDDGLPLLYTEFLNDVTHILHSIPPHDNGDNVFDYHGGVIDKLSNLQWLGYLSTTGVYGNKDGDFVDEDSEVNPVNQRGINRVRTEKDWLNKIPQAHVFRLSGIYGLKRNIFNELVEGRAKRIDKANQFFSRIHVSDIVNILQASINKPNGGSIYNCADDLPCSQSEVVEYAANLMGIKPPPLVPFLQANLSPMARSFYQSSRKVKNDKIKNELDVKLQFPNYMLGLSDIYKEQYLSK